MTRHRLALVTMATNKLTRAFHTSFGNVALTKCALLACVVLAPQLALSATGRTVGHFNVSSTGNAQYTIPIWAPPGPRGMQPQIALSYSSDNGIGPVGVGWRLAGLSAITRCGKTYAQYTDAVPVKLDITDGYCLDGNALRLTSGGTYGSAGSTYQTEIADFSLVTAVGAQGNGPASFTVKAKNGLTYEYGNTTDSRVLATGTNTASMWMVNQIADRAGNRIKFTYKAPDAGTTGTTQPISIEWTATSAGASSFVYSMVFAYGANNLASSQVGYVAGTAVRNDDLLDSISILRSGATVRKYVLGYETSPATDSKRLASVKECSDSAETDCLAPTTVAYQNGGAGMQSAATSLLSGATTILQHYDLNADGFVDLLSSNGTTWYVSWGSSSGPSAAVATSLTGEAGKTLLVGDLLGTGQDGVLLKNGIYWYYYTWNGSTFVGLLTGAVYDTATHASMLADINGDGLPDLVTSKITSTSTYGLTLETRLNASSGGTVNLQQATVAYSNLTLGVTTLVSPDSSSSLRYFDFNGDGRQDLALYAPSGYSCQGTLYVICGYWTTTVYQMIAQPGSTFSATEVVTLSLWSNRVGMTQWNNDGCTDIVVNSTVYMSGCNGTNPSVLTAGADAIGALDWNGDGRTDLIFNNGGTMGVYLSTGVGLSSPVSTSIPSSCEFRPFDANGDGLDDLGCRGTGNSFSVYLRNNPGVRPDLATSFTDGYGLANTVTYTAGTWNNHTKQADSVLPNKDVAVRKQLVSRVDSSDGIGGTYYTAYWYYGAATNVHGRGFAGFAARKTTDSRNGVYTIEHFERAFPKTGSLTKSETFQPNGTLISRRITTVSDTVLESAANNQRYFVHPSAIESVLHEAGGTSDGALILQSSATMWYDSAGNLTDATSTVTDKDLYSPHYNESWTQARSFSITPDTGSNWCLGLPTSASVTYTASNGEPTVVRSTSFVPDYANCRFAEEIIEPISPNRRVRKIFGFDDFGNVDSVAVIGRNSSGSDMATRTAHFDFGTTGQFPMSDTNALGQTTHRTFHPTFGTLATQTDPNGIVVVSKEFDGFGRVTRSTRADGTSTVYSYHPCTTYGCQNGDPASGATGINKMIVVASERDTSNAEIRDDWTYLDQLDRPIAQLSKLISGYSRVGRQYDNFGRVYRESVPCNAAGCATYWVTNHYDLLGRLTLQTRPQSQGVPTLANTVYSYAGRMRTVSDPQGKLSTAYMDVVGRVRRSQDHDGYYQTFGYDAYGSLTSVTDSLSHSLFSASYSYGIDAFQDASADMDLGGRTYHHNSLGELTAWSDANGQSFSQTYDSLSRPLQRVEPVSGVPTLTRDLIWGASAANHNIGQLQSVSGPGYSETYTYDGLGRLSKRRIISDETYDYDYVYHGSTGMLDTFTYPMSTSSYRLALKYLYSNGIRQQVKDADSSTVFWQANALNARGQVTQESLGNGVVTNRGFDAVTGWPSSILSGVGGGSALQNESYLADLVGNIVQRQNNNLGFTENFYYDNLYRLDYSTLQNGSGTSTNLDLSYDALGNITSRSDVAGGASWTYHPTKKHAVTQAGSSSHTYSYDDNGNAITRNGYAITWTSYNYPAVINGPGKTLTFSYGPDRQRYRQVYTNGSTTETTHYVGGALEKVVAGGVTDWRHTVFANGSAVAVVSRQSTGTNTTRYLLRDHQGSIANILNASGASFVAESFEAFGARRDPSAWSGPCPCPDLTKIKSVSRMGYTGHEMIGGQSMGLIHMNGRVHDAITGRFLSPDPYVFDPHKTQGFNRYSYVMNNPLSMIDPTGFGACDEIYNPANLIDCVTTTAQRYYESYANFYANIGLSYGGGPYSGSTQGGGPPAEEDTVIEEVVVSGSTVDGTEEVVVENARCWNGEQGNLFDGISGLARQVGNDLMWLGGFLGSMGTLSPEQHAANATQFGSNNTNAGILGADLAPAAQLAIPVARLGYVVSAARIPSTAGITAPAAVAMRNSLKVEYRLGTFANSRMGSYEALSASKTDAEIIASAGRTNASVNVGAAAFAASAASPGGCK